MLISNTILKVRGFLNAELAEKQFHGIAIMVFPILLAKNGKKCVREVLFLQKNQDYNEKYSSTDTNL